MAVKKTTITEQDLLNLICSKKGTICKSIGCNPRMLTNYLNGTTKTIKPEVSAGMRKWVKMLNEAVKSADNKIKKSVKSLKFEILKIEKDLEENADLYNPSKVKEEELKIQRLKIRLQQLKLISKK